MAICWRVWGGTWLLAMYLSGTGSSLPPTCESDIYCHGQLLHVVQMSSLYHDSKTFVDMKMKYDRNKTLEMFGELMRRTGDKPGREEVGEFVREAFDPEGSEFEDWEPSDWVASPDFLRKVSDAAYREWGNRLNGLWKLLGRKMKDDVRKNPSSYSIIYVPHPVIVPGGRFREFYYWDSYWIVRGLLLSEMFQTVEGMLGNFVSIVEDYGFIPNGGRIYYSMRSQPPLLIPMVKSYLDVTQDRPFLKKNIDTLEKEFRFWLNNRTVEVEREGKSYRMALYKETSSGPRPESYKEDVLYAEQFRSQKEKEEFYSELKSAAESGWDFSSRWFVTNGTNKGNLTALKIRSIIPVDLNAIMCWNARLLSEMYDDLGMKEKGKEYRRMAREWREAMEAVLWHDNIGAWLDEDVMNDKKRDYFTPSNLSPLWTKCYDDKKREYYAEKVMSYLKKSGVTENLGGVPTTVEHSGEQWDFPNAWPPLQYTTILGLEGLSDAGAEDLAFELTDNWLRSNYKAYNETQAMYEKYDATIVGGHGGGGEYEVQLGFGWTNGIVLELLDKYGHRVRSEDRFSPLLAGAVTHPGLSRAQPVQTAHALLTVSLALIATMAAGCIGLVVYTRRHSSNTFPSLRYTKLSQRPRTLY